MNHPSTLPVMDGGERIERKPMPHILSVCDINLQWFMNCSAIRGENFYLFSTIFGNTLRGGVAFCVEQDILSMKDDRLYNGFEKKNISFRAEQRQKLNVKSQFAMVLMNWMSFYRFR